MAPALRALRRVYDFSKKTPPNIRLIFRLHALLTPTRRWQCRSLRKQFMSWFISVRVIGFVDISQSNLDSDFLVIYIIFLFIWMLFNRSINEPELDLFSLNGFLVLLAVVIKPWKVYQENNYPGLDMYEIDAPTGSFVTVACYFVKWSTTARTFGL